MADINNWSATASGSPAISYVVTYSQGTRTSSGVTYNFNFAVNLNDAQSSFGYTIGYHLTINGQTFNGLIKDNTMWTGTTVHNISVSTTVTCGTGGGTLSCSFYTDRPNNDGTAGQVNTGSGYTVNVSAWNTAPYWNSGSITISKYQQGANTAVSISGNVTIPENADKLTVSWSGGTDTEGGTLTYTVTRYHDSGGGWISDGVVATSTTSPITDNIGTGNQGIKYYYTVYITDNGNLTSSTISSNTVTKNVLTSATISGGSSIGFSSTSVTFTEASASNTNSDTTFTYTINCDKIQIYNATGLTSLPTTITIYKTGTLPTGTYIKFDDIKSATSSNNYVGTFNFTLQTTNAYNSAGANSTSVSVDIRIAPTSFSVSGTGGYYTINSANYYVSNRQNPTITWGASTDQLGGSITYDVQYKLGTGSFTTALSGLTTTTVSISIPSINTRTACIFRIVAKTSFGYTTNADSSSITLDYYNPPTITFNSTVRNQTDTTVSGTITINTSIPSITVTTLTYAGKTSGSLTLATTFSKQETGLVDTDTYSFSVTAQDGAGAVIGTASTTASTTVPRYTPMLSIRELGVGVNAYADSTYKFKVGGNAYINGQLNVASYLNVTNMASFSNGTTTGVTRIGNSNSGTARWVKFFSVTIKSTYTHFHGQINILNRFSFDEFRFEIYSTSPVNSNAQQFNIQSPHGNSRGASNFLVGRTDNTSTVVYDFWVNTDTWSSTYVTIPTMLIYGSADYSIPVDITSDTTPAGYTNTYTIDDNICVSGVWATSTAGTANSIVKRDSSGYIQNTWFNSSRADETTSAKSYIYDSGDGYLRKKTLSNAQAEVGGIVGQVSFFAMNSAPSGWLKCNGSAVSRTTYATLFSAIGTTFGTGDGSTTFNLPDLRGEFLRAWDDARGVDSGRVFGSFQSGDIQPHMHGVYYYNAGGSGTSSILGNSTTNNGTIQSASTGGTETRPRNIALLACIKY